MTHLDARLLGPLEVRIDGEPAAIHGNNARKLLAILLDEAGRPVPIDGIVRGVWEDELPERPIRAARNLVSDLRRDLRPLGDRIAIADGGEAYAFRVEPHELDVLRCKEHRRGAAALQAAGDAAAAAAELRGALAEWRGPALSGVPGRLIESIARGLDEDRLALLEQRFDLELELGRGTDVLPELRQIVAKHATRQRFAAQLMRALHAAGRSVEALEHYEAVRERLADSLGVDPDPELRAVHLAILQDDTPAAMPEHATPAHGIPAARPDSAPPVAPSTLPPTSARFTGRDEQILALDQALEASALGAGTAVISGMGGVGKTELAVHWAHRVAAEFPDGRLYFNLRGFDPAAPETGPESALGAALRALGVEPHRIPAEVEDQTGLYRTLLADRKVLVVLDNVRDTRQARPLLPAAPGSFTVVTSRDPLVGLVMGGAWPVPLQALSDDESQRLLSRFVPAAGIDSDSRAGRRILRICGGLPLALSLVGAWAATRPHASLVSLAERLESTSNVLNVFADQGSDLDLRTVFACSYQELGARAAAVFRLLGLHPGPDVTAPAVASLAAVAPDEAAAALRELADAHLVEEHRPGRYIMHDLLRAYAVERLEAGVPQADRDLAVQRTLEHYARTADRAQRLLAFQHASLDFGQAAAGVRPEPMRRAREAAAWFAAEYQVLRGLIQLRSDEADPEREPEPDPELDMRIWQLAWSVSEYMMFKVRAADLAAAQSMALAAARRIGDPRAEVVSLGYLAAALMSLGEEQAARRRIDRALALADRTGQRWAKGLVLYGLTAFAGRRGDDAEALASAREALALFSEAGDAQGDARDLYAVWELRALYAVGWHTARLGNVEEARGCFDRLLAMGRELDIAAGEVFAALGYGVAAHQDGDYEAAAGHYREAVSLFERWDMRASAGYARELLGDTRLAAGDREGARSEWETSLSEYAEAGAVVEAAPVRAKLAGLDAEAAGGPSGAAKTEGR